MHERARAAHHHTGRAMKGMNVSSGPVDHAANGFHPHELLSSFDRGSVSRDRFGNVVREYHLNVEHKRITIADGVSFDAWTYNGRVPGPSLRATEGDRLRIHFDNTSEMPHTVHFHGVHQARFDGTPGEGEVMPGESYVYDFVARPFGTHLYHCHSAPLATHINRGLYGAFIVDPREGRPEAHEMVMVLNAFDTNGDEENEIYALNTVAFAYEDDPIKVAVDQPLRAYVVNLTEFDPINSLHLHANFFHLYRTGTSMTPSEYTDVVMMSQAERHMIEFSYPFPGRYMFHAHQSEIADKGWMSSFLVA